MRKTELTRRQLTTNANQWIKNNPKVWQSIRETSKFPYTELQNIIEKEYGKAHWRDRRGRNNITGTLPTKSDPGVPFTLEDAGGGKVKFKSKPTRAATRGQRTKGSSGTRAFTERITSPKGTDFVDSQRAMAEARAAGPDMDGGHITDLGRLRNGQELAVQRGRTVEQYQQRFIDAGVSIGHTRENIEPQPKHINRVVKPAETRALDNNLAAMDTVDLELNRSRTFRRAHNAMRGAPLLRGVMGNSDEFGVPEVGTMNGGGVRVEADPLGLGTSFMIP